MSDSQSSEEKEVQTFTLPLYILVNESQSNQNREGIVRIPPQFNFFPKLFVLEVKTNGWESVVDNVLQGERQGFIAVPDQLISAIIGKSGQNVKALGEKYQIDIKVSNQIENIKESQDKDNKSMAGLSWRIITINGQAQKIRDAIGNIRSIIEKNKEKLDRSQSQKTVTKFVFPEKSMGFMIGKGGYFVQELHKFHNVNIKIYNNETNLKELHRDDSIIAIQGALKQVIHASNDILQRINDYYKKNDRRFSDYSLKMIIASSNVSKVIGQRGQQVSEIARKSGASQIKVVSDKYSKNREALVKIHGSLNNKIEAIDIILHHLEGFKQASNNESPKNRDRKRSRSRSFRKSRDQDSRISSRSSSSSSKSSYSSKQSSNSQSSMSSKKYESRSVSVRRKSSKAIEEEQSQNNNSNYLQENNKIIKFTQMISVQMNQKLVENGNFLYNKITSSSQCQLQIQPVGEQLSLQIKGTQQNIRKAVEIILADLIE